MLTSEEAQLLLQAEREPPVFRPESSAAGALQWAELVTRLHALRRQGFVRYRESVGINGQVLIMGPVEITAEGTKELRRYESGE